MSLEQEVEETLAWDEVLATFQREVQLNMALNRFREALLLIAKEVDNQKSLGSE